MASISVALASHNGERHIGAQLDSLATQNCPPAELVVSDDCSEDRTVAIVENFARTAPFPVRLCRNERRLGYRANFMHAAELCRHELVAFCDQDDRWYPDKLASCRARLEDPAIVLVYHNADVVTEDGADLGSLDCFAPGNGLIPKADTVRALMVNPYGLTMVFRRSLLAHSGLWPMSLDHNWAGERMAHDQWAFFMAGVLGAVGYVDARLAAYVQHGGNAIGWRGHSTWSTRLRWVFENHAEGYRRYAAAAGRRADILDLLPRQPDPARCDRIAQQARDLRALARLFAERADIYAARTMLKRARAFRDVMGQGGYRHDWAFGRSSLCKDLTLGVMGGPLLPPAIYS
jgi:glycosyltransferase involved in cell wall biosynthesis